MIQLILESWHIGSCIRKSINFIGNKELITWKSSDNFGEKNLMDNPAMVTIGLWESDHLVTR